MHLARLHEDASIFEVHVRFTEALFPRLDKSHDLDWVSHINAMVGRISVTQRTT